MSAINTAELLDALSEQQRDKPGVSTTMLNLITFVEDPAQLERILDRLEKFTALHPCRAIVLDGSRGNDPRVRPEEIVLGVKAMDARELHSIVHDLLIPDVSIAVFWAGRTLQDPRFEALASLSTTLVVDSSRAADAKEALCDLAQLGASTDRYLRDLSYLRLLPWQDMVAQFFDDAELAKELPAIARVEIVSGSEPEAYYLAGWLASRLEWQPCGDHELCNPAGQTITVGIEKRGDPRRVQSIVLRSKHSAFNAELDPQAPDLVCLTVTGTPSRDRRCAPLHDVDLVSLVEEAMLVPRKDPIFASALQMARAIYNTA